MNSRTIVNKNEVQQSTKSHICRNKMGVLEEIFKRTLRAMEIGCCLLFDRKFDKSFWGEAVLAAAYLLSQLEKSTLSKNVTPTDLWYKQKPYYQRMNKQVNARNSKLYMIFGVQKRTRQFTTRNVIFNEKGSENSTYIPRNCTEENENKITTENSIVNKNKDGKKIRARSGRIVVTPTYFEEYELDVVMALSIGDLAENISKTFQEAMSKCWDDAIHKELNSLENSNTQELMQRPTN